MKPGNHRGEEEQRLLRVKREQYIHATYRSEMGRWRKGSRWEAKRRENHVTEVEALNEDRQMNPEAISFSFFLRIDYF